MDAIKIAFQNNPDESFVKIMNYELLSVRLIVNEIN